MSHGDDDDFDLEPHTPATLTADNGQAAGLFPDSRLPTESSAPTATASAPVPVTDQKQLGSAGASASSPPRYAHNPYGVSPRQSPAIPVGTPPTASPHRTPVGSLDQRQAPLSGSYRGGPGSIPSAQGVPGVGRYKTEMCRHVLNGNPCARGAACNFAHYPEELRSGAASSNSRPGSLVNRPRMSGASVDDGGKMGVAMSQEPPRPSWMGGPAAASPSQASAPIPVSPLAEAMGRPSSLPRGSVGSAGGTSAPRGSMPGSAPRFAGARR